MDKQPDNDFRHLIALLRSQFKRYPKREKAMRELLIHRDPKHAEEVLEGMRQKTVANTVKVT